MAPDEFKNLGLVFDDDKPGESKTSNAATSSAQTDPDKPPLSSKK